MRTRPRQRPGGERGTVTAELAVGLVAVSVVLLTLGSVVLVGVAQVQVTDAAAAGARLAARTEGSGVVRDTALRLAGRGATVTIGGRGELTAVTVTKRVPLLLPGRPAVQVDSVALAVTESVGEAGAESVSEAGAGGVGRSSGAGDGVAGARAG